jgi:gamma-glutamyl-gamma-aminobutyrate hydrolase PuuD
VKTENSSQTPLKWLFSGLESGSYPFDDLFEIVHPVYLPTDIINPNGVLVIWGGGDISPSIYNQKASSKTGATDELSTRDRLEVNLVGEAIKLNMPILGICRGAQLLCAMAGGKLVQHVDGHGMNHLITTDDGRQLSTTSVHHQMMYPWDVEHKLIAWTSTPRSKVYVGQRLEDVEQDEYIIFPDAVGEKREVEVVYFPTVKGLAIQGHPEFIANDKHEFIKYSHELISKYLIGPFLK